MSDRVQKFLGLRSGKSAKGDALLGPGAAEELGRKSDLYLAARTLVEGLYQGRHRTPQRGASTEFYDYRAYAPGDPTHLIDWRLYGRTDRYYIRRFRQDSQLTVLLVLDASASMNFAGFESRVARRARTDSSEPPQRTSKLRRAQELAAALAYLCVRQGDRVGLIVCGGDRPREVGAGPWSSNWTEDDAHRPVVTPPGTGWNALNAVIRALEGVTPSEEGKGDTPRGLSEGVNAAALIGVERGLVIAIGDALDEPTDLLSGLGRLRFSAGPGAGSSRSGHDVALLQVLTPDELDLESFDGAHLLDSETPLSVQAHGPAIAAEYTRLMHEHIARVRAGVLGLGGRHLLCSTAGRSVEQVRSFLAL